MDIGQVIIGFFVISLLLHLLNSRVLLPAVTIAIRWVRWILFSLVVAYLAEQLKWTDRPTWAVAVLGFLGWFLVESVYNWLAIRALSLSPLPLFPRFVVNSSGEEWPTQRRLFAIREWLRREKFHLVQSLKSEIAPGIFLRLSVFILDGQQDIKFELADVRGLRLAARGQRPFQCGDAGAERLADALLDRGATEVIRPGDPQAREIGMLGRRGEPLLGARP